MKNSFPGYYPLTANELLTLFKNAKIALDANALLDLYKLPETQANKVVKILQKDNIKDRLWMPFDVAWLYHQEVNDVIMSEVGNVGSLRNHLVRSKELVAKAKGYPYLDEDKSNRLNALVEEVNTFCYQQENLLLEKLANCEIKSNLADLFSEKLGEAYDSAQLANIYEEGQKRYSKLIPPGYFGREYSDKRKNFHDLIVWKQLLAYGKKHSTDIIFITGQVRPDWYYVINDESLSPRQELINEFMQHTNKRYYSLGLSQFVEKCHDIYNLTIGGYDDLQSSLKDTNQYTSLQANVRLENNV